MKINKIFTYALLLLPALLLQSCLKDQEDIFDSSATARVEKYLSDTQQMLQSSQYGWLLETYPEANQSYGGYAYTLQFHGDSVTSMTELDPEFAETTLYAMKNVDGPVISFDTYNPQLHFFATPSSNLYEAYGGDFEFVIDSIGTDLIKVHGNRNHNTMYLRRLTEPAADYLARQEANAEIFGLYGGLGEIGGKSVQVTFDRDNRQATFAADSTETTVAYCMTDKGMRFYQPVTVNGQTLEGLSYDDGSLTLTGEGFNLAGIHDPELVVAAIGNISTDYDAFRRTYKNIPHLDQFEFVTDADWLTLTPDANNNLTIEATANTTGRMRTTTVYVVNKLTNSVYSSFRFTQMIEDDLIGNYLFDYIDGDGAEHTIKATLKKTDDGLAFSFSAPITFSNGVSNIPMTLPVIYNASAGGLLLQAGQKMGTIGLSVGNCDMVTAIIYGGGYYTIDDNIFALCNVSNTKYGLMVTFDNAPLYQKTGKGLQYAGVSMNSLYCWVTLNGQSLGYLEAFNDALFLKTDAGAAKAQQIAPTPLTPMPKADPSVRHDVMSRMVSLKGYHKIVTK